MGQQPRLLLCSHIFVGALHKRLLHTNELKEIYGHTVERYHEPPLFTTNNLMQTYVNRGSMMDARLVFDSMLKRNVVTYNIMILGYVNQEQGGLALELYERMHQENVQPSDRTFVGALKACSSLAALAEGKQADWKTAKTGYLEKGRTIHSQVNTTGFKLDVFVGNTLMDMYAKCGSMEDARRVFDGLPHRDVVSWNAMIIGYSKHEDSMLALELYTQMQHECVTPNHRTFVGALKACSSLAALEEGKQVHGKCGEARCLEKGRAIHSQAVKNGFEAVVYVGTTLVDMYTKCGCMEDAWRVFDNLPHRDAASWNAMILGYSKKEEGALALHLFTQMQQEGLAPGHRTFVGALKACSNLAGLEEGKQAFQCMEKGRAMHFQVIKNGIESDVFITNTLVDMYAKCGGMEDARRVFDQSPQPDVVSWNAMILGYSKQDKSGLALDLFVCMQQKGIIPDHRTFVGILKACSSLAAAEEGKQTDGECSKLGYLEKGKAIHSQVVQCGLELDIFVGNTLVDMYSKFGSMEDARRAFDELPHRNVVSWNAIILGYSKEEEGALAFDFYAQMQREGIKPDDRTFVGALKACSSLAALKEEQADSGFADIGRLEKGRGIHSRVLKVGFESDVFVGTTLVDMYAKCGSMTDARCVFDTLPYSDVVSWNAMILGYVEQQEIEEAFRLNAQMQEKGLLPDSLAFIAILKACGNIAALEIGKELHSQIKRAGLQKITIVANSLVDMYAKCGSMVHAKNVFDTLPTRDAVTWSSLIAGYARQGESELVFHLFERMRQEGIYPNGVTFLSILTVCSHVGLVEKGQKYFQAMSKQYGITGTIEHYTCMIDLLGRGGRVHEAVTMVKEMPFEPDIVVWLTVLGACRKWKNVEVGRHAFENAVRLDEKLPSAYCLMSNIYADVHMQEESDKIQLMRKNAQAWKKPGQSWWTDCGGIVHTFVSGDRRHRQSKEIYEKMKDLSFTMKDEGHLQDSDGLLPETWDAEEEDPLCGHSERLAIACALINTPERTPIRIIKNLRVCDDCHKVIALISKIEQRNIICRDASRFHNFKEGQCSCGNYW